MNCKLCLLVGMEVTVSSFPKPWPNPTQTNRQSSGYGSPAWLCISMNVYVRVIVSTFVYLIVFLKFCRLKCVAFHISKRNDLLLNGMSSYMSFVFFSSFSHPGRIPSISSKHLSPLLFDRIMNYGWDEKRDIFAYKYLCNFIFGLLGMYYRTFNSTDMYTQNENVLCTHLNNKKANQIITLQNESKRVWVCDLYVAHVMCACVCIVWTTYAK